MIAIYAPITSYVLWERFKDYPGPRSVIILPIVAAAILGWGDRQIPASRNAAILAGSAYTSALAIATFKAATGTAPWQEVFLTVGFAAPWFAVAVWPLTYLFVWVGRASRVFVERNSAPKPGH